MSDNLRPSIILSVNRALLGEVFPELVAVSCDVASEKKFELIFFVDRVLPESTNEDISCIETEVIADFPSDFEISHRVVVSDHAELSSGDFWIFLRKPKDRRSESN